MHLKLIINMTNLSHIIFHTEDSIKESIIKELIVIRKYTKY